MRTQLSFVLLQITRLTDRQTHRRTHRPTEFLPLDRVCIPYSAVKTSQPYRPCIHYSAANACKYEPMTTEIVRINIHDDKRHCNSQSVQLLLQPSRPPSLQQFRAECSSCCFRSTWTNSKRRCPVTETTPAGLHCMQCGSVCTPSRSSLNTSHSAVTLRVYIYQLLSTPVSNVSLIVNTRKRR